MRIKSSTCTVFLFILALLAACSCAHAAPKKDYSVRGNEKFDRNAGYPQTGCAVERPINPNGVQLDVKHQSQDVHYAMTGKAKLCWAANIAMISTYLGNPRTTCQIASYEADDGRDCCRLTLYSLSEELDRCNRGSSKTGWILGRVGIYSLHAESPLSEDQIKRELSNGRPILAHTENPTLKNGEMVMMHHVLVISGYSKDKYTVLNSNRNAPDSLTYEQLLHGDTEKWNWDKTWYHLSFRRDGCNPLFRNDCDVCKGGSHGR